METPTRETYQKSNKLIFNRENFGYKYTNNEIPTLLNYAESARCIIYIFHE